MDEAILQIQNQLNNTATLASFSKARALLKQEPLAGHRFDNLENVRELKIRNSAFSILYTYKNDTAYIIVIRDQRGTRSAEALQEFTNELKKSIDSSIEARRQTHKKQTSNYNRPYLSPKRTMSSSPR